MCSGGRKQEILTWTKSKILNYQKFQFCHIFFFDQLLVLIPGEVKCCLLLLCWSSESQQVFSPQESPSRRPWTAAARSSTPDWSTSWWWRPGAPCETSTPRTTSRSSAFAPRRTRSWSLQVSREEDRISPVLLRSNHKVQLLLWRMNPFHRQSLLPKMATLGSPQDSSAWRFVAVKL